MQRTMLLGLALWGGLAARGVADENVLRSPDAFRQLCEKAMPELLQGHGDALNVFRKYTEPESRGTWDNWAWQFQHEFTARRTDLGDAVDWRFVGTKKVGSMWREYVYACRYAKLPIVWAFRTNEINGLWTPRGLHCNIGARGDLNAHTVEPLDDPACREFCQKIAHQSAEGRIDAAGLLRFTTDADDPQYAAAWARAADDLKKWGSASGRLLKCELVDVESVGGIVGTCTFAVQWERSTSFLRCQVYRPGKDWKLLGIWFYQDNDAALAKAGIECDATAVPHAVAHKPQDAARGPVR